MNLPDLAWQLAYGRLAWGIVLLAVLAAVLPAAWYRSRARMAAIAAAVGVLMLLPGQLSPAYALGLAFQYPSGLLLACCLLGLEARWRGAPVPAMPVKLATPLAIVGTALYLDAMGVLAQGYYYAGFGPVGAPVLALLGIAACTFAIVRGSARRLTLALLGALLLFTLLRLPSGNLWDSLLDPILWGWALVALVRHGLRRAAHWRRQRGAIAEPVPDLAQELPALQAAGGIEHLLSSEEHLSDKQ